MGVTDITLRGLAAALVHELARGLVIGKFAKVYRTSASVPASSRDADQACYVWEGEDGYILLVEIQVRMEANTGFRVFEYASRLHAAGSFLLADELRDDSKKGTPIPVRPVVLVLTGSADQESGVRKYYWTHPARPAVLSMKPF